MVGAQPQDVLQCPPVFSTRLLLLSVVCSRVAETKLFVWDPLSRVGGSWDGGGGGGVGGAPLP